MLSLLDANDMVTPGTFGGPGAGGVNFPGATKFGFLRVSGRQTNLFSQEALFGANQYYMRYTNDGGATWTNWEQIYHTGMTPNFPDMPQVGGDPIVESGSNADGEWTRWSDGTQITSQQFLLGGTYGNIVNGFYAIDQENKDFSVSFLSTPKLSISVASNLTDVTHAIVASDSGLTPTTSTKTGRIRGLVPTSTGALGVDVIAYGRWK